MASKAMIAGARTASPTITRDARSFPSPLLIEPAAKPQPQHAHIALKRPDGMGEHTGPIPLNQEMPAPGKYIAQHHTKNRYHGIERDDAYNQSCDAEAGADKMQYPSACLRVIAQIVPPKLRARLRLFRYLRLRHAKFSQRI